jgi:clathrin heavy chain
MLIITAIKSDTSKVLDYIKRLDNFDGPNIALLALDDQYKLYEEAFAIYQKFDLHVDAANVLLEQLNNISRAHEFAERTNLPDVWSRLANAYAMQNHTIEAIDCFVRANDVSGYLQIIQIGEQEEKYE